MVITYSVVNVIVLLWPVRRLTSANLLAIARRPDEK